jgi:nitrogenase molybdenum-iron protein alpha/beta subunit
VNKSILEERKPSICDRRDKGISCERESVSGAVSQRACAYCGGRVVLNPVTGDSSYKTPIQAPSAMLKYEVLAYKLGIAFCDHNHERKHPLAGFEGIENFVKEIHKSINSPVWKYKSFL